MYYQIAAFKGRNDAIRVANSLNAAGVPNSIIATPRAIVGGCGVSVRYQAQYHAVVVDVLDGMDCLTFIGFFAY